MSNTSSNPTTTGSIPTTTGSIPYTTQPVMNDITQLLPNLSSDNIVSLLNSGVDLMKLYADKNYMSEKGMNFDSEMKSPSTNIYQKNFSGTSNVYSPYLYYNKNGNDNELPEEINSVLGATTTTRPMTTMGNTTTTRPMTTMATTTTKAPTTTMATTTTKAPTTTMATTTTKAPTTTMATTTTKATTTTMATTTTGAPTTTINFANMTEKLENPSNDNRTYSSIFNNIYANSILGPESGSVTETNWTPITQTKDQYMTIDLSSIKYVKGTVTQGSGKSHSEWVKTYKVSVSTDGVNYNFITETGTTPNIGSAQIFTGNTDRTTRVRAIFNSPIRARYVRFHPVTFNVYMSMRAGVIVLE